MLQLTQIQATLLAALIGALSALLVVIVKDLIIEGRRQRRREKSELLDRRLMEIYSPLWVIFGGDDGVLSNILMNENMRSRIATYFHLLSPDLQVIISKSLLLGKIEDGKFTITLSDMKQINKLTPKFKEVLKKDLAKLQEELRKRE